MEILTSINASIEIVKRLREISKNIEVAEFSNLLADLSNELADSKMEVVTLKEKVINLKEKIRGLERKEESKNEVKTVKMGCYLFEDDNGLYCTACFDTKGDKIRTTRIRGGYRKCPVCNAVLR